MRKEMVIRSVAQNTCDRKDDEILLSDKILQIYENHAVRKYELYDNIPSA